jgi:hypothetical protein
MDWIKLAIYYQAANSSEHGNEPLGSTKGREFLDQLSDYRLFKGDLAS